MYMMKIYKIIIKASYCIPFKKTTCGTWFLNNLQLQLSPFHLEILFLKIERFGDAFIARDSFLFARFAFQHVRLGKK